MTREVKQDMMPTALLHWGG